VAVHMRVFAEGAHDTTPNVPVELPEKLTLPEGSEIWLDPCELPTVAVQLELAPTICGAGLQTKASEVAWSPIDEVVRVCVDEPGEAPWSSP
jgi:hypothetical protein